MTRVKAVASVESLPSEIHGSENLTWWGALGGEVIEGFVLLLGFFVLFYLRHAAPTWPPLHTRLPSLGLPTANLVLYALSIVPAYLAGKAARDENRWATLVFLLVHALIATALVVIRYWEFWALNVRWDTNAYGSITWALLFGHGYTMLFDVFDTWALVILVFFLQPEEKHWVDITENSFFWYFVVASWIPIYLLVFVGPRW
jgi:heme/copper-type cytochrome/quinol oxidase subunit 3